VTDRRREFLLWFGLAAPPLAWALELLVGWGVDDASCARASMRWGIDDHLSQAGVLVVTGSIAIAGLLAAVSSFRAVRAGRGDARGRAEFMAVTSLSAGLLFVLLTVMTGLGVLFLEECRG
jgi:hypothetical protein